MKLLIIPIGPPGSGKTTLREYLREYCLDKDIEFRSSNRDEVFQSIRVNNSLNKTRKLLYDKLQDFYKEVNSLESSIIYIDSVNAKENIRVRFLESIEYDTVLYINFRISKEKSEFLLDRTMMRKNHPTFPTVMEEQKEKISIIFDCIEYQEKKLGRNSEILEIDLISEDNLKKKLENFIDKIYNINYNES